MAPQRFEYPPVGNMGDSTLTNEGIGTRDLLLSSTILLHRAVHRAGVKTELHVFEAMSHAFNIMAQLPEAREANLDMVRFFDECMDAAAA